MAMFKDGGLTGRRFHVAMLKDGGLTGRPFHVAMFKGVLDGDWCDQYPQSVQLIGFCYFSGWILCILAEGAIALPVTLSGGALFAS